MTRPGALLTKRDEALLRALADYRQLTVSQVARLDHFVSRQTATRRLRRLTQAGLLRCATVQGHPERIVVPTVAGLAACGITADRRDIGRLPAALFLRHALAVAEFRIALTKSIQHRPGVELVSFVEDAERVLPAPNVVPQSPLRASVSADGVLVSHSPDAAFALSRGRKLAAFYLEMDMGTEVIGSPTRGVGKFVRFYRAAQAGPAANWLFGSLKLARMPDAVCVLVVTSSRARLSNIRTVCGTSADTMIWITDMATLQTTDVLGPQWLSLDPVAEHRQAVVVEAEAAA